MFKFLIALILLAGSSLFVTEVFALEIELQKESDRIIESKGWLTPDERTLKEHLQIIIDQREFKNRISVVLMSKNPADIQLPENIEAISSNPNIFSMTITNEFACAPTKIDKACVIIEVEREGLGDNLAEMKNNAREIANEVIADGVIIFSPEFYSSTFLPNSVVFLQHFLVPLWIFLRRHLCYLVQDFLCACFFVFNLLFCFALYIRFIIILRCNFFLLNLIVK